MITLGVPVEGAAIHAQLVLDTVRVERYAAAIRAVVRPDDVVVDIGSGSGVLALLAARAGARKVYAVEATSATELIRIHARDNGFDAVVEVLRGDARDVRFALPPTVIVTEMMGVVGVDEGMLPIINVVARKCAPGVRMIPSSVEVCVAPVRHEELAATLSALDDVDGLRLSALRARARQQVFSVGHLPRTALCGPAVGTGRLTLPGATLPRTLTALLRVDRDAEVNAVAAWFRAGLAPGVDLETGPMTPATHWGQILLPVDPPLACRAGDELELALEVRNELKRQTWAWRLRRGDELREADGVQALCADNADDLLRQLGATRQKSWSPSERLLELARALGGTADGLDAMAARLHASSPDRYDDVDDARRDLVALLSRLR